MKIFNKRGADLIYPALFAVLFISINICLFSVRSASAQRAEGSTVISGKIVGGDGKPMPKAYAALIRGYLGLKPVDVSDADKDGNFRLTTTQLGVLYIVFNGLNHPWETVAIYIDRPKKIGINVKLSVPEYQEDLSVARADRNTSFKKQPDGTYLMELTTSQPTYPYSIGRVFKRPGVIQGTDPGELKLQENGILLQRIAFPVDGKVTIHIDPSKLPKPSGPTEVRFSDSRALEARFYEIYREMQARQPQAFDAKPRVTTAEDVSRFIPRLDKENDPLLKKMLWLSYLDLTIYGKMPDPPMIEKALEAITPTSAIWVLDAGETLKDSVKAINQPSKYDDYVAIVMGRMPIDNRVGKPVPAFTAQSFADPKVVYTNANLKAKVYLVDFWATWCVPCVAQMPFLRRAYQKYHDQGFEILSYSVDKTRDVVTRFQKGQPMPWLNAMDPALTEMRGEMAKQFRVAELPAEFLVDGNGKVLATTRDLQGPDLEKALAAAFAKADASPKANPSVPSSAPPTFKTYTLNSKFMDRPMPYNVILPAGYESDTTSRFPVIYMLHGRNGSYRSMSEANDLLRAYTGHRFVIVTPEGGNGFYTDSITQPTDRYETYLIKELVPEVDKNFRTISDRSGRGIAGGSMGGYGALKFGIKYPQMFAVAASWFGAVNAAAWRNDEQLASIPFTKIIPNIDKTLYSIFGHGSGPALPENDLFHLFEQIPQDKINQLPFFYLDCGTEDEAKLLEPNKKLAEFMVLRKIPHEYRDYPGGHQLRPSSIPDFMLLAERYLSPPKPIMAK